MPICRELSLNDAAQRADPTLALGVPDVKKIFVCTFPLENSLFFICRQSPHGVCMVPSRQNEAID